MYVQNLDWQESVLVFLQSSSLYHKQLDQYCFRKEAF